MEDNAMSMDMILLASIAINPYYRFSICRHKYSGVLYVRLVEYRPDPGARGSWDYASGQIKVDDLDRTIKGIKDAYLPTPATPTHDVSDLDATG
jgi:hypothetical protein